jgi:hypothetical protein
MKMPSQIGARTRGVLIPLCLGLGLALGGCSKSDSTNAGSGSGTASPTPPANEAVTMGIKWDVGQRYVFRMDIKQKGETSIPGRNQPMKQDASIVQEYSVTVPMERQLELEYLAIQMEVMINDRPVLNFDSGGESLAPETNPMVEVFRKIVGMKIQFFLNESNHVERVEGLANFTENILTQAPARSRAVLSGMFGEETFKQMVNFARSLPPPPVKPGDAWNSSEEVVMGPMGKMRIDMDSTFKDWEEHQGRQCARFHFQGTLASLSEDATGPMGMQMNLRNGVLSGESLFDPNLGMSLGADIKEVLDMDIIMKIPQLNDRGGGTQTLQTKVDQVIKLKLVELGDKVL